MTIEQHGISSDQLQLWAKGDGSGLAPAECLDRFLKWLPGATAEERHSVAATWNWGFGVTPLRWIVSQGDCAAATAALIFFDGEPQDADDGQESGKLVSDIRERWLDFSDSDIGYDPPRYVLNMPDDRQLDVIPLPMRQVIAGRSIATDGHHEGIPVRFFGSQA